MAILVHPSLPGLVGFVSAELPSALVGFNTQCLIQAAVGLPDDQLQSILVYFVMFLSAVVTYCFDIPWFVLPGPHVLNSWEKPQRSCCF